MTRTTPATVHQLDSFSYAREEVYYPVDAPEYLAGTAVLGIKKVLTRELLTNVKLGQNWGVNHGCSTF